MTDIPTLKPDSVLAVELRDEVTAAMHSVLTIMDRARASKMQINFSVGVDQYGRSRLDNLSVVKVLA